MTIDTQNRYGAENIMNTWGISFPIVKIGEYLVNSGDLLSFSFGTRINSLPNFNMEIVDNSFKIRKELVDKKIDSCVINLGFKTFKIRFNGLITKVLSEAGSPIINVSGILWNEKFYESTQDSYISKNVSYIIKEICEKTKMGLFLIDNEMTTTTRDIIMRPNLSWINFLVDVIEKYTTHLWCVDPFYYLHVADIKTLRERCLLKKIDKYSIGNNGETLKDAPIPITLTSSLYPNPEKIDEDDKFSKIDYYTIESTFSSLMKNSNAEYYKNKSLINSDKEIGYGSITFNTFAGNGDDAGFTNRIFPFREQLINKLIGGNFIKTTSSNIVLEIAPFDIVDFRSYLPRSGNEPMRLDEAHSGCKIVIGYNYVFEHANNRHQNTMVSQNIELI